jgi:hypothetical protein
VKSQCYSSSCRSVAVAAEATAERMLRSLRSKLTDDRTSPQGLLTSYVWVVDDDDDVVAAVVVAREERTLRILRSRPSNG